MPFDMLAIMTSPKDIMAKGVKAGFIFVHCRTKTDPRTLPRTTGMMTMRTRSSKSAKLSTGAMLPAKSASGPAGGTGL